MIFLIIPVAFQLIQSSFVSPSKYKDYTYSILSLVGYCRIPDAFLSDEVHVHELALKLRSRDNSGDNLRHTLLVVEKMYARYLQRIRKTMMGQANVGRFVEDVTNKNAWAYCTHSTSIEVYHRVKDKSHVPGAKLESDIIKREYFKNAKAALKAYFLTMHDYREITQPAFIDQDPFKDTNQYTSKNLSIVDDFITTKLAKFDYGTTYPNAVMCLSLLQNLKYIALLNSNLKLVEKVCEKQKAVITALKNMKIRPARFWSLDQTYVCLMPQERVGPIPIPVTVNSDGLTTVVRMSYLDVRDPDNIHEIISLLERLDIISPKRK